MKHAAAIFLIAVFAFSQYAKQLAYMECKLANAVKPSSLPCDCEKTYNVQPREDKMPAAHQSLFHPVIDEFYAATSNKVVVSAFNFLRQKGPALASAKACKGNCTTPYRPPQA